MKSVSIQLNKTSEKSLQEQLAEYLKRAIKNGNYKPEERLPSIRVMSEAAGVNSSTVVAAYKKLEEEGYISIRKGSGAYVRKRIFNIVVPDSMGVSDELYLLDDVELMRQGKLLYGENRINMASTTPDHGIFDLNGVKKAIIATIDEDAGDAFAYQDSHGYDKLRQEIANQLNLERISATAEDIQIVSGAQQGLDIIAKTLLQKDDTVITETPTYSGAIAAFKSRGAKIQCVEMDKWGMDIDRLQQLLKRFRPKLIYTTPNYQNPTGCIYSMDKKLAMIKLAESFGCYIVEDDYMREMSYGGKLPTPLKTYDEKGVVIYIKSFSKLLYPGLRIGYMLMPKSLSRMLTITKHATDIFTSGLIQRSFYRFICSPYWMEHMKRTVEIYKSRYKILMEAMKELNSYGLTYEKFNGGLSLWVNIPSRFDTTELYYRCMSKGLQFVPGNIFWTSKGTAGNFIRLSFAQANEDEITNGIEILKKEIYHR